MGYTKISVVLPITMNKNGAFHLQMLIIDKCICCTDGSGCALSAKLNRYIFTNTEEILVPEKSDSGACNVFC